MTSAALGRGHVPLALPAGGENAARAGSADLLDLTEHRTPPPLAARGGCRCAPPGATSAVREPHLGVAALCTLASTAHPGTVDDLDGLPADLRIVGAGVTADTHQPGIRRGYVTDPGGHRIELLAG